MLRRPPSFTVSATLSPALAVAISDAARAQGVSVSEFTRTALRAHLRALGVKPDHPLLWGREK